MIVEIKFKVGDVVLLRSGGPAMTVWEIRPPQQGYIIVYGVTWFQGRRLYAR